MHWTTFWAIFFTKSSGHPVWWVSNAFLRPLIKNEKVKTKKTKKKVFLIDDQG
jgi:hypothetical protein